MTIISKFKAAGYAESPAEIQKSSGRPIFQEVTCTWSAPQVWHPNADKCPLLDDDDLSPCVYIITRDHHRSKQKEMIAYIGLTTSLATRFQDHPKAAALLKKRGTIHISKCAILFPKHWRVVESNRSELEELEHILIWALYSDKLLNEKKIWALPGQGQNGGRPWHIINKGHSFSGRMPREIIFPWMLVLKARDRSQKKP
jgi:hypothetical protein